MFQRYVLLCLVVGVFLIGYVFLSGGIAHGAPDYLWSGGLQDGLPMGQGVATFADGRLYVGEMLAGILFGKGTLSLPDGTRYTGEFADGKYQGMGVYTFANGDRYIGGFQAGVMHGTGLFRPAGSEERYQVEYVNGERIGYAVEVQAASLLHEPLMVGIDPVMLRKVAKVHYYIQHTIGLKATYTSGLRDPVRNKEVGGVLNSLHMQGRAVDLVVSGITPSQEALIVDFAIQQGLGALWHGLGDNYHLHLQLNEE